MAGLTTFGLAALFLTLGAGSALAAQLYRWVDAQGVVHYSDTPQPGAERIQVQSAQTFKAPPVHATGSQAGDNAQNRSPSSHYECSIVSPTPEQEFYAPENIPVSVSVNPQPREGSQVEVTVDGNAVSGGQQIDSPDRGVHTVTATVKTSDGTVICTTAPVTINVQRPSLLSPQSPAHH
jgi:hypothetical protein